MNPCTLMGGFWWEAGKALFGASLFAGILVMFLLFCWWISKR